MATLPLKKARDAELNHLHDVSEAALERRGRRGSRASRFPEHSFPFSCLSSWVCLTCSHVGAPKKKLKALRGDLVVSEATMERRFSDMKQSFSIFDLREASPPLLDETPPFSIPLLG